MKQPKPRYLTHIEIADEYDMSASVVFKLLHGE
jgi:hypothetical protein